MINMFEKAYEFDNDVICALEWILFMILGNGNATSSTSTRSPSSGKFSQILTGYVTKCQKIFLIGRLSENDSGDFPETFSKKKYFAVLWRHYGR